MKRTLLAIALGASMMTAAHAQLNLGSVQSTKDPLTGLAANDWIKLATNLVDGSSAGAVVHLCPLQHVRASSA